MSKPWLRLYRREEGSFAQLPLYVRALAAEILKLTNDEGVIHIGRRAPWEAIAFALGATQGERRMLRRDVAMLLDDGFLVHEGETLRAPSFPRFQCDESAATRARAEHEPSTNDERPMHEPSTSGARAVHENKDKSAESFNTENRIREEKRREDHTNARAESLAYDPALGIPEPKPAAEAPPIGPSEVREVLEVFEAAWRSKRGSGLGLNRNAETQRAIDLWRSALAECPSDPMGLIRAASEAFAANAKPDLYAPWRAFFANPWVYAPKAASAGPDADLATKQAAAQAKLDEAISRTRTEEIAKWRAEVDRIAAERRRLRSKGGTHAAA